MKQITVTGQVASGTGVGRFYVTLPWARKQFKEKLGFNPYPGTLNLRLSLSMNFSELRNKRKGIKITPRQGFYAGRCFKALIQGEVNGAVVIPDVPDYSDDLLEIIAPVKLRDTLKLRDGMNVEVTIWI